MWNPPWTPKAQCARKGTNTWIPEPCVLMCFESEAPGSRGNRQPQPVLVRVNVKKERRTPRRIFDISFPPSTETTDRPLIPTRTGHPRLLKKITNQEGNNELKIAQLAESQRHLKRKNNQKIKKEKNGCKKEKNPQKKTT